MFPMLNFNCRLIYLTPGGKRVHAYYKTTAIAADLAVEIAERLLRKDKRRQVTRVVYSEAISQ